MLLQTIPRSELESCLADRVKFHAVPAHQEALKTALKTYLNGQGGEPVLEETDGEGQQGAGSIWVENIDD